MNYIKIQIKALKPVGTYNPRKSIETEDITYLVDGGGFELYAIPNKELIINPKTLGD